MSDKAVLRKDGTVELCDDLIKWARWMELPDSRRVSLTEGDGWRVSTVFLGLDHNFMGSRPLWFETMIFGGPLDEEQWRYSTIEEARAGHRKAVALCENAVANP